MANYIGMNYNLDAVCYDAWDETTIMAFKDDVVQFFTNEVLTSTASRIVMFPQVGTTLISSIYRASYAAPSKFWQLYFYDIAGNYWRYETTSFNPTGYTFLSSGSHPWMANIAPRGEGWQLWFKNDNGVAKVDVNGNTGIYMAYGPPNTLYPTLPNTQVPDACWHNTATGEVYVSIIDTIYVLDTNTTTVTSFAKYNVAPPTTPPTPLTPIEIVYSAPSQFNLFSSDVALVTETQYGWNFTKTINDNNKMELYLYHSSATGAIPFNYNDLLQITVNMKNNLVLPAGEIFMNVYTGPPVAPNWYNYKDTYNFSPALGTTIDVNLVEHILNLTDARSDPILAISLHSNSAQQQINCDVDKVSFNIILSSTSNPQNSQRVIVKLQNNFIALDNHYWDLDDSATARLNTTIIPAFDINSFSPNIVAGNFPTNAIAKESSEGCALFVSGTWQLWETTDGTNWTATPNATLTLIATTTTTPTPPGPSSNGFAYIGTEGMFDNYGTGLPVSKRPIVWNVSTSNQLEVVWTGSSAQSLAPLSNMTTPNNFTAAQIASGFFDTLATAGSTAVGVFISTATSPSGEPVASRDIDIVVKSETEISIKRSWELSVTTYIINPNNPKEITGQYTDPIYTTSVAPTSFSMPTNWLETANNAEHFEILFSAGLNNSLPAESQNFRQMTVTPTPYNTELTFTWTANYYTAGNILISAVAGITTTGLVSSFTTGGSLKPANAAYILYGCTSSDNVDAFTSLVFIEPEADPVINLTFQSANNQILTDGTYTVTVVPTQTVQYDAVFRDLAGASLGAVPGFGTSGTSSSFTITYAILPATVAWIDYQATDGTSTAQLSITIVPQAIESFVLTFQNPTNQIDANGIYSVSPIPLDPQSTYAYTANYMVDTTVLAPVTGAGASGSSSAFSIDFAAAPATSTWINYTCIASGGTQDGETSQLSITLIHPTPPVPPQPGPGGDVQIYKTIEGNIFQSQHNPRQAMKMSVADKINMLELSIVDSQNNLMNSQNNIYYEIENIIHDSNMIN